MNLKSFAKISFGNNKKIHLISWDTISKPKEHEGLGLRNIKLLNQAYFLMLGWTMIHDQSTSWIRILHVKYNYEASSVPHVSNASKSSHIWKGLVQIWHFVTSNLAWSINNGHLTHFWLDSWIPRINSFQSMIAYAIHSREANFHAFAYTSLKGWCQDVLNLLLPPSLCAIIAPIPAPREGPDDIPI